MMVHYRLVLVVEESPWFYGYHLAVSETQEDGSNVPVCDRHGTHLKAEDDDFDALLSAVRAIL